MTGIKKTKIGVALGSAFAAGMTLAPMANSAQNPFALQSLQSGYMVAADTTVKAPEAKCGQGKCGSGMSGDKAGEAKCGMSMMDKNKDGRISKREFMKAHQEMFAVKDANKNGYIDADEMGPPSNAAPAAQSSAAKTGEAKCGQGKCGSMHK